jgi:uncharacterized lipoprotein YddW (UPF0748 family)
MKRRRGLLAATAALAGCAAPPRPSPPGPISAVPAPSPVGLDEPPPAPREFRAAWVATVAYIDWPSRAGLDGLAQQAEIEAAVSRAAAIGLNALVLQVRPVADALYAPGLEPWSEVLSGQQGRAPSPLYDPLAAWIAAAHRRGLELHAWFNPYRASHTALRSSPAASHLSRSRPQWVRRYGDQLWIDPGEPEAMAHTLAVVADVVRRYDIDGIQLDDYFYPYPVNGADGRALPFPDDATWQRHGAGQSRDDWRRGNVDRLLRELYRSVHAIKPPLRVGISPFGIGRPALRPPGIEGFSQYDQLFADVERWVDEGWLDYLAPQLYWPVARPAQAFPVLLDYWQARLAGAAQKRHLWPGLFTSSVAAGGKPWPAGEIEQQIRVLRERGVGGHLHFSLSALLQDRDGIATRLGAAAYAQPALVPATPWLAGPPPPAPRLQTLAPAVLVESAGSAFVHALWQRRGGEWHFSVLPATQRLIQPLEGTNRLVLSAVDRAGNEGPRSAITLAG